MLTSLLTSFQFVDRITERRGPTTRPELTPQFGKFSSNLLLGEKRKNTDKMRNEIVWCEKVSDGVVWSHLR